MPNTHLAEDIQRRFAGMERLYGPQSLPLLGNAHVIVAGIGGVGSWCAEALARSGVGALSLVDLDHIAESNINRQLHAMTETLGQSKVVAMAQRVRSINPLCRVEMIDDFVTPENVAQLLTKDVSLVVDCTDQAQAKIAMILQARQLKIPIVVCGGAGGKTQPLSLRAGDLSLAVNDALLSKLRNTLRRQHRYPKAADAAGKVRKRVPKMDVRALWFDQPVLTPSSPDGLQGLSCAGYGSAVTITAAMGFAAASEAIHWLLHGKFSA